MQIDIEIVFENGGLENLFTVASIPKAFGTQPPNLTGTEALEVPIAKQTTRPVNRWVEMRHPTTCSEQTLLP